MPGIVSATKYMKIRLRPCYQEAYSLVENPKMLIIGICGSKCKGVHR